MVDSDYSIQRFADPVLSLALDQELDMRDIVRRLHQAGEHPLADALEAETFRRHGILLSELAKRLPRRPGVERLNAQALERWLVGLRPRRATRRPAAADPSRGW